MDYRSEYECWLQHANADIKADLEKYDDAQIEDSFYRNLAFGTGGLRGVIGSGTNRMNVHTVAKASQGLANYLVEKYGDKASVAIGYDSRIKSDVFAKTAAAYLQLTASRYTFGLDYFQYQQYLMQCVI